MTNYLSELAAAQCAAERAGELIRTRWGTPLSIDFKGDVDLVSDVDLAAEQVLLGSLRAAFPDDTIVAEESSRPPNLTERVWHVDPLDGTTNFSHAFPHFSVSVALVDRGDPAVAVIHDPIRQWTFHARRGGGAWLNGRLLKVSAVPSLDLALLATGFPYDRRTNPDDNTDRLRALLKRCQGIRRQGSAALDLAYVAAGWLDGYWEDRLKSWDIAAGLLLVKEAGGVLCDFLGAPVALERGEVVACTPAIQREFVDTLRQYVGDKP